MSYTVPKLAKFGSSKAGLSTVGYQLLDADRDPIGSRITAGVEALGQGDYGASVVLSSRSFAGYIVWDTGGGSPTYAREEIAPATLPDSPPEGYGGSGSSTGGDGDITVNHNYGGTDALRVVDTQGVPVDNAVIRAFVAADYAAGLIDPNPPKAKTSSDGRWLAPLQLDAAAYTLTVFNPATKTAIEFPLTVEAE